MSDAGFKVRRMDGIDVPFHKVQELPEQQIFVDPDADNKAVDADEALQELGADDVAFGYLHHGDRGRRRRCQAGHEKLLAVERIVNGRGIRHYPREFGRGGGLARQSARQPYTRKILKIGTRL